MISLGIILRKSGENELLAFLEVQDEAHLKEIMGHLYLCREDKNVKYYLQSFIPGCPYEMKKICRRLQNHYLGGVWYKNEQEVSTFISALEKSVKEEWGAQRLSKVWTPSKIDCLKRKYGELRKEDDMGKKEKLCKSLFGMNWGQVKQKAYYLGLTKRRRRECDETPCLNATEKGGSNEI